MLLALTTSIYFSLESLYKIKSSTIPPLSFKRQLYWASPSFNFETSLLRQNCSSSSEPSP